MGGSIGRRGAVMNNSKENWVADINRDAGGEKNKIVIGALKECTTRVSLEETFKLYNITDTQQRIDKLNQCMGNPQTFFSSDEISIDDKYELTIQMFLTMSWKLNEIYDRMGLETANA
jgi:hypothetical protein